MTRMPDETQPPQPTLSVKRAHSFLYLAQHHDGLRADYDKFCAALSGKKIPWDFSDERFIAELAELESTAISRLGLNTIEELGAVAEKTETSALSPEELKDMDDGLVLAQSKRADRRDQVFAYTESVVDAFVKELKASESPLSPDKEEELKNRVASAADTAVNTGDATGLEKELSEATGGTGLPDEIKAAARDSSRFSKTTEVVINAGDEIHKGVLVQQCLTDEGVDPELIASKHSGVETAKALDLSDEVRSRIDEQLTDPNVRRVAFRQAAENVQRGLSQPINDVIDAVGGPQGKEFISSVINSVLGKTTEDALSEGGTTPGERTKPSGWNIEKIKEMEASLAPQREARSKTKALSKGFFRRAAAVRPDKTASAVATASSLWGPKIQDGFREYVSSPTLRSSVDAPMYFQYVILSGTDAWRGLAGGAAKSAAQGVVSGLAKEGGKALVKRAGGEATRGILSSLLAGASGGTSLALGSLASWAWGGIKGFFSSIGRVFSGAISGGGPPPKDGGDLFWATALAVFIAVGILFYGLFLPKFREKTSTAAIVASAQIGQGSAELTEPGRGVPHDESTNDQAWNSAVSRQSGRKGSKKPLVDYAADPQNAQKIEDVQNNTEEAFLVKSSDPNYTPKVTQLPGDARTHRSVNAVDIGAPIQSIVISPINGTVTSTSLDRFGTQYPDGSGYAGSTDGGGYGNYIDIKTPQGYVLRVAHLAYNSFPQAGESVSAGQTIGRSGQTGNSTGPHIHFEIVGSWSPNILTLIKK